MNGHIYSKYEIYYPVATSGRCLPKHLLFFQDLRFKAYSTSTLQLHCIVQSLYLAKPGL